MVSCTAFVALSPSAHAAGSIGVYLSKPQSQTTTYSETVVETFESLSTGQRTTNYASAIGTYNFSSSIPVSVQADNQFGMGTGQYIALGAQSSSSAPFSVTFATAQSYFGFSWSAGDSSNGLTFYNGSTNLGRFSTALITSMLSQSQVSAVDGTTYNSADYKGKPGSVTSIIDSNRQNSAEPYAFLNFIGSGGMMFDRVVFDNSGSTSSGFESDNHTIRTSAPTVDQKSVFVGGVGAPEPGAFALALPFLPLLGVKALRRRK